VINFPCIRTKPLKLPDSLYKKLCSYNWLVFTSPTGAEIFFDELKARRLDIRLLAGVKIAAVGEKTAQVFYGHGINVDHVPENYNARELGASLPYIEGDKVLIYRARDGTPGLVSALRKRGFSVEDAHAYATVFEDSGAKQSLKALENAIVDVVAFTSTSTVQGFTTVTSDMSFDRSCLKAVCIGEETAAEARRQGYSTMVSKKATIESMIEKIIDECGV
jgi:uroporphyrinogen III methyltransferase/synthase